LCLDFKIHTIPITKISTIPPPRRQYKIPREPCVFIEGYSVADGSKDEVGEICVSSKDESVTVKTGIIPLLGSTVAVNVLGLLSIVGLVVDPGV
jgi:hypothetical protein